MKKIFLSTSFLIAIFFLISSEKKIEPSVRKAYEPGRWTGTVTMEQVTIFSGPGISGRCDKKVITSFNDALPTMYRDKEDAAYQPNDNKGTGSFTEHCEVTTAGKTCVTECQGSGQAELHAVVINEDDHHYDIEAIGPGCNGSTCNEEGGTREYSDNDDDITITEPLGSNINELNGSTSGTAKDPSGLTTTTTTITWHLAWSTTNDILIVTPDNYDQWLPVPGKDENTKGSRIKIALKLVGRNRQPPQSRVKSFEIRLANTSKEPGITINYPVDATDPKPDLKFIPQAGATITEDSQFVKFDSPDGINGNISVAAYDGGAYTTLMADAILEDRTRVHGHLLVETGEIDIPIPKRDPGSKIGKAWSVANGNPGDMDDKENLNGNNHDGDGLTAYEEYRGVVAEGEFKRLNPRKKEVGIQATETDFLLFAEGISWFKDASGLEPVRFDFDRDEIAPDGTLNMNTKYGHDFNQHAIYLMDGGLGGDGTLGITYGRTLPLIPANINAVVIDWNYIQQAHRNQTRAASPATIKFTLLEYLAQTVAHELGHAVNIWHHGTDDAEDIAVNRGDRIFLRDGSLINPNPDTIRNVGKSNGTVEGGNISCMLNYYPYFSWGRTVGADGVNIYNQEPLLPIGRIFCKSPDGTGINASQLYFGKAAKGNCFGQIQLRN